jgi:hypothetical protein
MKRIIFLMLFCSLANATDILLTWDRPTVREDGSPIEQIDSFKLYRFMNNASLPVIDIMWDATSYQLTDVEPGSYTFQISTVEFGQEGAQSDPVSVNVDEKVTARIGKIKVTIEAVE